MAVRIVTDSTCDLMPEVIAEHRITVAPLFIYFGEDELRDGVDVDAPAFYNRLVKSTTVLPRTAQPTPEDFEGLYRPILEAGDEVVSIHISGKLSGTLNAAHAARGGLGEAASRVSIIDSANVSLALGAVVLAAAAAATGGADRTVVVAAAESARERIRIYAFMDTLEYLHRGGRIGRAASLVGSLLQMRPIIHVDEGEVAPFERVRTHNRAVERLFQIATSEPDLEMLFVASAANVEERGRFAARLREALPQVPVVEGYLGPTIGVYVGPSALGIAPLRRAT